MAHAAAVVAVPRVIREEYPTPPVFAMPQVNARPAEIIGAQRAPDPPRQGDTPTRPARMPVYVSTAIDAYHAVMQDDFFVRLWGFGPAPQIAMPQGRMAAFADHGNIRSPQATPYGSQFSLQPANDVYLFPVGEAN